MVFSKVGFMDSKSYFLLGKIVCEKNWTRNVNLEISAHRAVHFYHTDKKHSMAVSIDVIF